MSGDTFLRLGDVKRRLGLSTSTIYARMDLGDFPMVRRDGGIAFWLESEIDEYMEKVKARASMGPSMGPRRRTEKKPLESAA